MQVERMLTVKYAVLQGAYWFLAAVGLAFVTPLLEGKGYSGLEIGYLNAVKYLSVIVFQVWLAAFSDRHAKTIPLQWIMLLLGGLGIFAAGLLWWIGRNFWVAVVIFILYGMAVNCLSAIVDSLSVQYMNHGRCMNYTVSRAVGSASWAVACVLLGVFSDYFGVNQILLVQIAATVFFMVIVLLMDPVDFSCDTKTDGNAQNANGSNRENDTVHSSLYILRNFPKYVLFLLGCMFVFMGYNLNATYMIDIIHHAGGNHTAFGIGEFVLAASEVPFALVFVYVRRKISVDRMMVVCALFCTLRAAATTFAPSVTLIILSQGFEILGLSIFYAASVYFVMENLPDSDVIKGVSFINVASVGVGQMIGSVLCGIIKSTFGLWNLLYISIAVSFVGVLIMIGMVKAPIHRKQNEICMNDSYTVLQEK